MLEPNLFNKDDNFDVKAREILQDIFKPVLLSADQMLNDAQNCYKFADILIDNGLILFTNVIPKQLYREVLNKVIEQFNYIGSYNAYYTLLKLFYGSSAVIQFTTLAPAHLQIDVSNVDVKTYEWIDSSNNNIINDLGYKMVFADRILDLTEENLTKLIENIKPTGYIVDIIIH